MKTIDFKINNIEIDDEMRLFNDIYRFAYNRFRKGIKEKEVRAKCNDVWKGQINSWLMQCAIKDAAALNTRMQDKTVIFGGKHNLKQLLTGRISKDQYKSNKQVPLSSQGEMLHKGNRLFDFRFNEHKIIFKASKSKHIEIELPKFHNKWNNELLYLQTLIEQKKATVSVKLSYNYIWLTYDETLLQTCEKFNNFKKNRIMGLDLNPNYIGLSVIEFDKQNNFEILHKQVFDLTELNKTSGKASTDKKSIHLTNKRQFELIEICYSIRNLMKNWHCAKLAIEDLNIKPFNKKKGRHFNRLCNNVWHRGIVVNKLKMLANVHGFELVEVMPHYSSTIGNVQYGDFSTPDMVASSIEIARRGYRKFEKGWFWPVFDIEKIDEQWKQTLLGVKDWKEVHQKIKNLGLKYRVQLFDCIKNAVFSKKCLQSNWKIYIF